MTPFIVIVALVAFATVLGFVWKSQQGRVRRATGEAIEFAEPGAEITLLQFSTEVCSPCVATRAVLDRIANDRAGVAHVDVDITNRPDIASRFSILQTPTTLILDAHGSVKARIGGAARPTTVVQELDRILVGSTS